MGRTLATTVGVLATLAYGIVLTFCAVLVGTLFLVWVSDYSESAWSESNAALMLGIVLFMTLAATLPCMLAASLGARTATRLGAPPAPEHRRVGLLRGGVAYVVGVGAGIAFAGAVRGGADRMPSLFEGVAALMPLLAFLASPTVGLLAARAVLRAPGASKPSGVDAKSSPATGLRPR